jgi:hypothetical protein
MLRGEIMVVKSLAEHALCSALDFPDAMEENGDKTRLEVWVFDVFRAPQKHNADLYKLFALGGGDDVRHHSRDELEITNNVFDKVLRKTPEGHVLNFRKRQLDLSLGKVAIRRHEPQQPNDDVPHELHRARLHDLVSENAFNSETGACAFLYLILDLLHVGIEHPELHRIL